jgi:hypothetical protein
MKLLSTLFLFSLLASTVWAVLPRVVAQRFQDALMRAEPLTRGSFDPLYGRYQSAGTPEATLVSVPFQTTVRKYASGGDGFRLELDGPAGWDESKETLLVIDEKEAFYLLVQGLGHYLSSPGEMHHFQRVSARLSAGDKVNGTAIIELRTVVSGDLPHLSQLPPHNKILAGRFIAARVDYPFDPTYHGEALYRAESEGSRP